MSIAYRKKIKIMIEKVPVSEFHLLEYIRYFYGHKNNGIIQQKEESQEPAKSKKNKKNKKKCPVINRTIF